jgi:hypothetical protein
MYPGEDYNFDGEKVTEFPMMKKGGWLSKFDTAQKGKTIPKPELTSSNIPYTPITLSTNVKAGTKKPTITTSSQEEILDEQQRKENENKPIVEKKYENIETVKQDNRTSREKEIAQQELLKLMMQEAQGASPFAQTLSSFTPTGSNEAAGQIAAENIGQMTPMMGATRLFNTARDFENNPYGIGQGNGFLANTLGGLGLVGDMVNLGSIAAPAVKQAGRIYNTVATGESALPIAWKSPAKGLSQEASQNMFDGLFNTNKLSDADRALLLEYQYDSKPFTGRLNKLNESKRQALNDIIKNNELNFNNDAILTRKFNPDNKSLGAEFANGRLNLGDRPTSFSAGVGNSSYGSGSVDRIVIPKRYSKNMSDKFLANEYGIPSRKTFDLLSGETKNFAAARGVMADDIINVERELIGTGLNFKRIGKVKNDIGGYDHVVKPFKKENGGWLNKYK